MEQVAGFISTPKGGQRLLLNGYGYALDKKRGDTSYWRCDLRRHCSARCTTVNDILKMTRHCRFGQVSFRPSVVSTQCRVGLVSAQCRFGLVSCRPSVVSAQCRVGLVSAQCRFGLVSFRPCVVSTQCRVGVVSFRPSVVSAQCRFGLMSFRPSVVSAQCRIGLVSFGQIVGLVQKGSK